MLRKTLLIIVCLVLVTGLFACETASATPAQASPTVTATSAIALITPTPQPTVDPAGLSEQELAGTIDETAGELDSASQQAAEYGSSTAADGVYTLDEITTWYELLIYSEQLLYELDYYIEQYDMYYEAYASVYVELLQDLEAELATLDGMIGEITSIMLQGEAAMQAGAEQVASALEIYDQVLPELSSELNSLSDTFNQALADRQAWVEGFQPTDIAATRAGAVAAAVSYVQTLQNAYEDAIMTPVELQQIAQLAANAQASLQAAGGELAALAGQVSSLTQLAAAAGGLAGITAQINALLGAIPSLP